MVKLMLIMWNSSTVQFLNPEKRFFPSETFEYTMFFPGSFRITGMIYMDRCSKAAVLENKKEAGKNNDRKYI